MKHTMEGNFWKAHLHTFSVHLPCRAQYDGRMMRLQSETTWLATVYKFNSRCTHSTILHYVLSSVQAWIIASYIRISPTSNLNWEKDTVLSKLYSLTTIDQIGAVFSNFNRTPNTTRLLRIAVSSKYIYFLIPDRNGNFVSRIIRMETAKGS